MRTLLAVGLILSAGAAAMARDLHLTPAGAGRKDGSSWEDALDQQAFSRAVNEMLQPGERLLLGSGAYQDASLTVTRGGAPGQPKTIIGVDRGQGWPVLVGNWDVTDPERGPTAIRLEPGVSHVAFEHLRMRGFATGVAVPASKSAAVCTRLAFRDVDMEQFRYGFFLSNCEDLQLEDCDLAQYSKHGFRFEQGCHRGVLRRCTADCSRGDAEWEKQTELLPFGFTLNDGGAPNTEFLFEDCLAQNNLMPLQKNSYKNGDGFVVEANSAGVKFVRCRGLRNQDGGFDLKVRDVQLLDCVAIGNSRNFRIWTTGAMKNCFSGWAHDGLWCNGGPVTVERCTFHELQHAVVTDDRATQPVALKSCLITAAAEPVLNTERGRVVLEETVILKGKSAADEAGYVRPDPRWNGLGDALNSRAYPLKGCVSPLARAP